MPVRNSEAEWVGNLREGKGRMKLGSGSYEGPYTFVSRFEQGPGTNPEELIGAAHAGCFSMALAADLTRAGFTPKQIHTAAAVHLEKVDGAFRITRIELRTEAEVPEIAANAFQEHAQAAKQNCPVSRALTGVDISLEASLVGA